MSYQALLFCPDEKTARVITQVLVDLEFTVDPCNDPFAAVKKLMAQHFDAIVVDCDNEQNATLLFKTARTSDSNQSSLAVAVVEGQAGVAKAFRIGANLVLTKPINVEQSKGTLRVARGLLRKADANKTGQPAASEAPRSVTPTIAPTPVQAPRVATTAVSVPLIASPKPAFAAAVALAETKSAASAAVQSNSVKKEDLPAEVDVHSRGEAGIIENSSANDGDDIEVQAPDAAKEYPWQPVSKSAAGPMAVALQRAAEAAEKSDSSNSSATAPSRSPVLRSSVQSGGAASATAPAKEIWRVETGSGSAPDFSASPSIHSQTESKASSLSPSLSLIAPPTREQEMDSPTIFAQTSETEGGSKTRVILIAVLLLLAGAGYFGWTKFHSDKSGTVAPSPVSSTQPAISMSATNVSTSTEDSKPTPATAGTTAKLNSSTESQATAERDSDTAEAPTADRIIVAPAPVRIKQPLVVKNSSAAETSVQPVAPADLLVQSSEKALAGIMNATAVNYPRASQPDTFKISQGVSQGLLLKRVQPTYPQQAIHMRVQGAVQLQASIGKTGDIASVKPISGDPLLTRAAMDAVRQWKYKPYYLNGEPVSIQTQITVNFKLP